MKKWTQDDYIKFYFGMLIGAIIGITMFAVMLTLLIYYP